MRLDEDAVDLFEVHDPGPVTHRFDERTQAEVAGAAQQAFAGPNDQGQGFGGEDVMPQAALAPSVESVFIPPSVPGITDAYGPLDEAVGAIMAGTATDIQVALDDAATRANQILTENQNNYGDAPAP